jgi:hypothetical protein
MGGAGQPGELADEERVAAGAPADRGGQFGDDHAAGDRGELTGHLVLAQAGEPEDLAEQPVRRAALVGYGPGPDARHAVGGGAGRRLGGQPGLADSRLAADQRHAAKVRVSGQAGRPGWRESSLIKRVHPVLGGR